MLSKVDEKKGIVEAKLAKQANFNVTLKTQLDFILQTQFNLPDEQKKFQRENGKNNYKKLKRHLKNFF